MNDVNDENVENENENKKKKDNEENNKFNNQDFLNNISEELKAEMGLLKYYSGTGKMIGAFYSGLLEEVSIDLAIEFTKVFIETYVNNLFRGQKG
jgi:hypothetical protein